MLALIIGRRRRVVCVLNQSGGVKACLLHLSPRNLLFHLFVRRCQRLNFSRVLPECHWTVSNATAPAILTALEARSSFSITSAGGNTEENVPGRELLKA